MNSFPIGKRKGYVNLHNFCTLIVFPQAPLNVEAGHDDSFVFLTAGHTLRLPTPPQMKNEGKRDLQKL